MNKLGKTFLINIRKQQIFQNKLLNPQISVPKHSAYKPIKAKIQQARLNERIKKEAQIDRQNNQIMNKLFTINKRKPSLSKLIDKNQSTPSFSLPPIILKKKPFIIPQHQQQNNIIAQKLIASKSSINLKYQLKEFYQKQKIKQKLSKYHQLQGLNGGQIIDRKRYIAELMMLKKLKLSEQTQSRIKDYIAGTDSSRLTKKTSKRQIEKQQREYYSNR